MAEETPKPLLYRPPAAWYFWAAFGGALAIHLTAVALAQKHEAPVEVPPDIPTAVIEATLQATEEPTPPPEDIPLPEPPLRLRSSRSLWKKRLLRQRNRRRKNSPPLRRRKLPVVLVPCQFPQRKRWPLMRRARSTRMRRVHGMLLAAECVSSKSVQAAA